jgi:predicted ATP-grasp superfamily ATP-dependent carboligase
MTFVEGATGGDQDDVARHPMASEPVTVLMSDGGYYGTLATARTLGRQGVPVTIADPSRVASALWSRHVTRRLLCPPAWDVERFVDWLDELGGKGPRHVVFPTSDDVSFALGLHQGALNGPLAIYQPDLSTLLSFLDKSRLLGHARAVGLEAPETWLPETDAEAERVLREAGGTLVIKPRTQALLRTKLKGLLVTSGDRDSKGAYARFRHRNVYAPLLARRFPEMTVPMMQRYHREATSGVYSLAGFRDHSGRHVVMRAAVKVLARPRQLGIGLCFEGAPLDAELAAGLCRLLERVGYYGIFEAEFIRAGHRSLLIDLNARLYNQIGFDIARGLPLPTLLYDAALGRDQAVADAIASIPRSDDSGPRAFCNRFGLAVLVGAKRLSGTMSREDAERWRAWLRDRQGRVIDAVADGDDPGPMALEIAQQVLSYVRHPRTFIRTIALDR